MVIALCGRREVTVYEVRVWDEGLHYGVKGHRCNWRKDFKGLETCDCNGGRKGMEMWKTLDLSLYTSLRQMRGVWTSALGQVKQSTLHSGRFSPENGWYPFRRAAWRGYSGAEVLWDGVTLRRGYCGMSVFWEEGISRRGYCEVGLLMDEGFCGPGVLEVGGILRWEFCGLWMCWVGYSGSVSVYRDRTYHFFV